MHKQPLQDVGRTELQPHSVAHFEYFCAEQAVSDAHTHLFTERERLLQLRAENDALRAQEVSDRARIQRLLSSGPNACHPSQVTCRSQTLVQS